MLELKCRDAREDDLDRETRILTSCNGVRVKKDAADDVKTLMRMWEYQESCGIANPMNRVMTGIDFLMPIKRGSDYGSA